MKLQGAAEPNEAAAAAKKGFVPARASFPPSLPHPTPPSAPQAAHQPRCLLSLCPKVSARQLSKNYPAFIHRLESRYWATGEPC